MRFTNRKRRQPPTIIIISLIDILIVLLIFLMVTTTFKQQPAIKLTLPESKQAKEGSSENTLVVTIGRDGMFHLGALPVTLERLEAKFVESLQKNPQVSVAIRLDKQTPFGEFAKVADIAAAVGIKSSMSIYTQRPGQP